jgi:hypothetical protein
MTVLGLLFNWTQDGFTIALRIGRVDVALDDLVAHEAISHIRRFPFSRAGDGVMPQEVPFVGNRIGADALVFAEVFERVVGVEGLNGHAEFLAITAGVEFAGVVTVDLREFLPPLACETFCIFVWFTPEFLSS